MKQDVLSINLLFPVLNERLRLENGIERSMAYLKENVTIPYQLTILDNGSEDETPEIGKALAAKYPEVSYVRAVSYTHLLHTGRKAGNSWKK